MRLLKINCMFDLNFFGKAMRTRKKTTQTIRKNTISKKTNKIILCVFFPNLTQTVYAQAGVKHTIYFEWPDKQVC